MSGRSVTTTIFGLSEGRNTTTQEYLREFAKICEALRVLRQRGSSDKMSKSKSDRACCQQIQKLITMARAMVGGQSSRAKVVFSQNNGQLRLAFYTGTRVHGDPDFRWGSDDSCYTGRHWCGAVFNINLD